jgi:hypothetical protein
MPCCTCARFLFLVTVFSQLVAGISLLHGASSWSLCYASRSSCCPAWSSVRTALRHMSWAAGCYCPPQRDLLWAHQTACVIVQPRRRPDFLLCVGQWVWSLAWDTEAHSSGLHRRTHIDWIYYVLSFIFYCICCGSLITGAATSEWTSPPLHLCVAGTVYDRCNFQPHAL